MCPEQYILLIFRLLMYLTRLPGYEEYVYVPDFVNPRIENAHLFDACFVLEFIEARLTLLMETSKLYALI